MICGVSALEFDLAKQAATSLVRVRASVNLLSETADFEKIEDWLIDLCWPKVKVASDAPPLRLRLVRVTVGKTKMWMLTSDLDELKLTVAQIVS